MYSGFDWALLCLKGGFKMRRHVWPIGMYVSLEGDRRDYTGIMMHFEEASERWSADHASLLANDWGFA